MALAIGAGSGPVCVGNSGSRDRCNCSALGDAVNVAARREAMCRHVGYDILVSETVAEGATGLALLDAGHLALKGRSGLVRGHVADVAADASFRVLGARHAALVARLEAEDPDLAACPDDFAPRGALPTG